MEWAGAIAALLTLVTIIVKWWWKRRQTPERKLQVKIDRIDSIIESGDAKKANIMLDDYLRGIERLRAKGKGDQRGQGSDKDASK